MSDYYDHDAEIEDTCHCDNCGYTFRLGGNDHIIAEVQVGESHTDACLFRQEMCKPCICKPQSVVSQLTLCMRCAGAAHIKGFSPPEATPLERQ